MTKAYSKLAEKYIESVDGKAHNSAVQLLNEAEDLLIIARDQLRKLHRDIGLVEWDDVDVIDDINELLGSN